MDKVFLVVELDYDDFQPIKAFSTEKGASNFIGNMNKGEYLERNISIEEVEFTEEIPELIDKKAERIKELEERNYQLSKEIDKEKDKINKLRQKVRKAFVELDMFSNLNPTEIIEMSKKIGIIEEEY